MSDQHNQADRMRGRDFNRVLVLHETSTSRLVEDLTDGTRWVQEIYTDDQGRKCWQVQEVEHSPRFVLPPRRPSTWSRLVAKFRGEVSS